MSEIGVGDLLLIVAVLLLVLAVFLVSRHYGRGETTSPTSRSRSEAEEELNLLKGGSLWGDVYLPRFVSRRGRRAHH